MHFQCCPEPARGQSLGNSGPTGALAALGTSLTCTIFLGSWISVSKPAEGLNPSSCLLVGFGSIICSIINIS